MEKLSVVIITFNEEKNIGRCIDSVKNLADEIVVLDSFSTDKTVSIAKEKRAAVYEQEFSGYTEQKNKALSLASFNYVLSLDADEAIDKKLESSILAAKKNFIYKGYSMNRCTNYCGKFIRHGTWYPDRKLRLFDKTQARWEGQLIHEKVEFFSKQKTCHLPGDILHYSYYSVEEHYLQRDRFVALTAQLYFQKGKKFSALNLLINPVWTFVSGYLLRLGFLDGKAGFNIAWISAQATRLKYKTLKQLYRQSTETKKK